MTSAQRIAVVGAGPKGLYCLERLAAELERSPNRSPLEVHVFEPHPYPGAGPVYDPRQPDFLRMNFDNGNIDMWHRDFEGTAPSDPSRPTFVDYLAARGDGGTDTEYAPRRVVGTYLTEGFGRVVESLQAFATVSVHPEVVQSIVRRESRFEVATPQQSLVCSEVLLATGHSSRTSRSVEGIAPYPIDQRGGVGDIAPGCTVAVRGLGLTAIDVALALTEGRGGNFIPAELPGQLRYASADFEAGTILPYSRTGRYMVPKPHPLLMPATTAIVEACARGSRAITAGGAPEADSVSALLVRTSASVLDAATGESGSEVLIRDHLETLLSRETVGQAESIQTMRAAVEIAYGRRQPGPDWALGAAWRGIYPALVKLVRTRRLDDCWSKFSALATEMERVAFGPPAENAARLLALIDAGIVDTSCATNPLITEADDGIRLQVDSAKRQADVLVNAVLDPPGVAPDPAPLIASVLSTGLARATAHSPGLEVQPDGTCIGGTGAPTIGLAAIGRPTEGSVLGNDTLSRRLHDTPGLWASRTVRRLGSAAESSAA